MALKYQRILLKISGEALGGEKGTGFDEPTMDAICGGVKKAHDLGVQIGIVVGGGNFWRGRSSGKMERTLADKIGMLATVMNALAVSDKLEQLGVETEVFTSITMPQVAPAFTRKDALGGRALYPLQGHPPSGEGESGHLRLRHRQPLLLHRYHHGSACC